MGLRGRGVIVVAVAVAFSVTTAGCSSDPEPDVTPTPTLSSPVVEESSPPPEPTSEPTPTALTDEEVLAAIPEEAQQENFWGAQEFTRFFLENYPRLVQDERDLFMAVAGEDCVFCVRTSEFFDEAERRDHVVEGGEVTVIGEAAQGGRQEDGTWVVIIDFDAAPLTEHDAYGELISEDVGGAGVATVALDFTGHWSILEVAAEAK